MSQYQCVKRTLSAVLDLSKVYLISSGLNRNYLSNVFEPKKIIRIPACGENLEINCSPEMV